MNKSLRSGISFLLKCLTVLTALGGLILSFLTSKDEGYKIGLARLTYFTGQSNLWIGVTFLLVIFSNLFLPNAKRLKTLLYTLKYVFTVSITITALVFFCFLAPFATPRYHVWSYSSYLTHLYAPLFAIADFFVDDYKYKFTLRQKLYTVIPPSLYVFFTALLAYFNVDFGRGVSYPYFFLNYFAPWGFFAIVDRPPFVLGTFYWLIILPSLVIIIGVIYASIKNKQIKNA